MEIAMLEPATARRVDLDHDNIDLDLGKLGDRITWARFRERMTQKGLAKLAAKVRPTIAAYESGRIMPPIDVVQSLAQILKVSPAFIAFKEPGSRPAPAKRGDTLDVYEMSGGKDGIYRSGSIPLPRRQIESYSENTGDIAVYVINSHAPAFNLSAGDRAIVDLGVDRVTKNHDMYLITTNTSVEIVRREITIIDEEQVVRFRSQRGGFVRTTLDKNNIIGAVVGSMRQN